MPKPSILLLCLATVAAAPASAAEPRELAAGIDAGGRAYLEAVRGGTARPAVAYYDPERPAPELRTDVAVEPPEPPLEPRAADPLPLDRWVVAAVFAVLLLIALGLAVRFGGVRAVSFARPPERGSRPRTAATPPAAEADPGPDSLEAIARLADRRRALHVLLQRALEQAARATGRNLARSQTAREALRALPPSWPPLPGLGRIVVQAEMVRFGGRELSEAAFRACLDAARPIFAARNRP